jgi:uncharacterized membrane protein
MSTDVSATAVPATSEFGLAWTTYVLFGIGVLIWWPSIIGLVLCYVRGGSVAAGFLSTHYRWLIRTFWWSLLGYLIGGSVLVASAWPILRDVITAAREHEDSGGPLTLNFDWSALFATAGLATVGGLVLLAVWGWTIYRVFRGAIRLANAQPTPS